MKEKIKRIEQKYDAQERVLDSLAFKELDTRTLHQSVKSMLVNTTNDCIKFECEMDPEMSKISFLIQKENIKPEEYKNLRQSQAKLKSALHLAQLSESALRNLLFEMMISDEIKFVFKQDIPELYEGLYFMLDIEEEILDVLVPELAEQYETNYKTICSIISGCINDFVDNVEEYIEDIKERELYNEFVEYREEWRKIREASKNE